MKRFHSFVAGSVAALCGIAAVFATMGEAICGVSEKPTTPSTPTDALLDGLRKDRAALASDWKKVGLDIRTAMDQYVETH